MGWHSNLCRCIGPQWYALGRPRRRIVHVQVVPARIPLAFGHYSSSASVRGLVALSRSEFALCLKRRKKRQRLQSAAPPPRVPKPTKAHHIRVTLEARVCVSCFHT